MTQPVPFAVAPFRWALIGFFLSLIVVGFISVLLPFIRPLLWATVVTVVSWPLYMRIQRIVGRRFPNRPSLPAALMTLVLAVLLLGLVVPLLFGISREIEGTFLSARDLLRSETLEISVRKIPIVGGALQGELDRVLKNREALIDTLTGFREQLLTLLTFAARGLFQSLVTCGLTLFICFFFYRSGEMLLSDLKNAVVQIGGSRMEELLRTTHTTLVGSVYGLLMTAMIQGIIAAAGYVVAGAPLPLLLGFFTMIAALIPFGPPFVYMPAALLIAAQGEHLAGFLLLCWGLGVVSIVDNFLRPYFLSQSTRMPILLSVMGVLGGLLTFGLIGIFVGPVLVALVLVLWREWQEQHQPNMMRAERGSLAQKPLD